MSTASAHAPRISLLILKNISRIFMRPGSSSCFSRRCVCFGSSVFGRDFCQGGPIKPRAAIVAINALGLVLALALRTN